MRSWKTHFGVSTMCLRGHRGKQSHAVFLCKNLFLQNKTEDTKQAHIKLGLGNESKLCQLFWVFVFKCC